MIREQNVIEAAPGGGNQLATPTAFLRMQRNGLHQKWIVQDYAKTLTRGPEREEWRPIHVVME